MEIAYFLTLPLLSGGAESGFEPIAGDKVSRNSRRQVRSVTFIHKPPIFGYARGVLLTLTVLA